MELVFLQMTSSPNTVVSLAGLRCDNGLSVPVGQFLSVNSIINPSLLMLLEQIIQYLEQMQQSR